MQGHVVLTDFGLCKEGVEPEGTTSTFCGTPEVSKNYSQRKRYQKENLSRTVRHPCLNLTNTILMICCEINSKNFLICSQKVDLTNLSIFLILFSFLKPISTWHQRFFVRKHMTGQWTGGVWELCSMRWSTAWCVCGLFMRYPWRVSLYKTMRCHVNKFDILTWKGSFETIKH